MEYLVYNSTDERRLICLPEIIAQPRDEPIFCIRVNFTAVEDSSGQLKFLK